ncbi:UDP-glucuronosyltransferase [Aphelenchoides bicaudatus]|nr:UDP-glucuronosyltransferase [Aphelenchoides bicaudatus]
MRIVYCLFILPLLCCEIHGAKILAGFPVDALSHLYSIASYLKTLANDGHHITVLHTGKLNPVKFDHPNITVHYVHMDSDEDVVSFVNGFLWKRSSHAVEPPMVMAMGDVYVHKLLDDNSESVYKLMNAHYDLIIVEQLFNPIMYSLAKYHKRKNGTPYIQYSSSHPLEADAMASGIGRSWAAKMSLFVPIPKDSCDVYKPTDFLERLINFFEHFADYFLHTFAHYWTFAGIRRFGLEDFDFKSLRDDSSLYLSDHFRGFEANPLAYDFRLTGAYCQGSLAKPLPDDLEQFVSDPTSKGTIYLAFGSLVRWSSAPQHISESIFGALNELRDYRVLISSKGMPKTVKMKKHVKVLDWAPQVSILEHNKTRVFLSHGGLKSVKEAICSKTPVVYIPLFAEQAHNARQMTKLGIATLINKYTLNKSVVLKEVKKVLKNPLYQQRMGRFHAYFSDQPIPDLNLASHLTNRIIKKKGKDVWYPRKGQFVGWLDYLYLVQSAFLASLLCLVATK